MVEVKERLSLREISKSFPGVQALKRANLTVRAGEIHALLGENGAGKSTMIKIVMGVHQPDEGTIYLEGQPVRFRSPREAFMMGISVVHQERNLIPRFTVAENIALAKLPARMGFVDYKAVKAQAMKWLDLFGLPVAWDMPAHLLNTAQAQMVEIARALALNAKILLLDEPTASLTEQEAQLLFQHLERLSSEGISIVLVSHKLEEILQVSDVVTVLRDGSNVATSEPVAGLTKERLVQLMVGRDVRLPDRARRVAKDAGPVLELQNISTSYGHENISFRLHRGEILGLYGPVGSGRSELVKALLGFGTVTSGQVAVRGKVADIKDAHTALKVYGIGYISEDRKGEGLILAHPVNKNIGITTWERMKRWLGVLDDTAEDELARSMVGRLDIQTPSIHQRVENLSGGNQQKVSVAKWLAAKTDILIIDEPTVGIDVQARAYLHELILELADTGTSILLISSDMAEMIGLADRILVMGNFQMAGELENTRDYDEMSRRIMDLILALDGSSRTTIRDGGV